MSKLDRIKIKAKSDIDDIAFSVYSRYVNLNTSQLFVYAEKSEEATDYIALKCPSDLSNFPLINAEVEVTGRPAERVATNILAKKAEWISICVKVEKNRLGAKHKIDNVLSEQEVLQIRNDTIETLTNL